MKKKILALILCVVMCAIAVTGATLAYFTDTTDVVKNTFTMGKVKIDLDEAPVDEDGKKIDGKRVTINDYTTTNMVPGHVFDKDPTIHVEAGSEESYIFLDMSMNKYKSLVPVMAQDAVADASIDFDQGDFNACIVDGKFSTKTFLTTMVNTPDVFRAIMNKWFNGIEHAKWTVCGFFYDTQVDDTTSKGNYMTIRFAYNEKVNAKESDANIDIKFMDSFQMPTTVTQEMVSNKAANVNAFGTDSEDFHLNFTAYAIQADELATTDAAFAAMFGELGSYWNPVGIN